MILASAADETSRPVSSQVRRDTAHTQGSPRVPFALPSSSREQRPGPPIDLLDDGSHCLDRLSGRVFEIPVHISLPGVDGTGVAATHGHDDLGLLGDLFGERLGNSLSGSKATLSKDCDDRGVQLVRRVRTRRAHFETSFGVVIEENFCGKAAPRVVGAEEQDYWDVAHSDSGLG